MFNIEKMRAKGMSEDSIKIMEQMNENQRRRESCDGHDFDVPGWQRKYRCKNCGCEEGAEFLAGYNDACSHKDGEIAALKAELSALRADIEAGRRVRVPVKEIFAEAGNVVYLKYDGEVIDVVHCGASIDADGKVWVRLAAEDKIFPYRQPDPEHDTDPTDWCRNGIDISADDYSKLVFLAEQAARAAMEDGNA